ncbi:MAG: hypothetical protein ACFFB5_07310 [Promethearchaeota archaeon]
MPIQSVYSIIAILGGGFGCFLLLNRRFHWSFRPTEIFHFSLIVGTFILIVPWILIGIQPDGVFSFVIIERLVVISLFFENYIYLCYGILMTLSLYVVYHLMRSFILNLENFNLISIKKTITWEILLFLLLIFEYFSLQFILPLRGLDALNYYLPEAEIFYFANKITDINYLSYTQIEKAPLNTLLFTFSYYVSNERAYQMFPLLFLIGSSFLGYDLSMEVWGEKIKGQLVMLVFLVLPVVYWTMSYWAFYQDLYICYFFGVSFYFIWKGINQQTEYTKLYTFIGSLSMVLSLLSQINAWALYLIIILVLPTQKRGKIIQIMLLIILSVFLMARAITHVFIGLGLIILCFAGLIAYHIIKRPYREHETSVSSLIVFFIGSMILGSVWIIDRITKSGDFLNNLYDSYFRVFDSLIWEFNGFQIFSLDLSLEKMHIVNFWSASLYIFLGIGVCLPWILLKVIGLIQTKETTTFSIWVIFYYMIWITYYLQEPIGFLSPIYVPLAILIVQGFYTLINHFKIPTDSKLPRISLLFFGCINFYYYIPFLVSYIFDSVLNVEISQDITEMTYNQLAFFYYSHTELAFVQVLIFAMIWVALIGFVFKFLVTPTRNFETFSKIRSGLTVIIFSIVLILPITLQSYVWLQSNGDIETFQSTLVDEYDHYYQAIVTKSLQDKDFQGAFLTVKTTGLQYFTLHPVLDFYYQSDLLGNQFYSSKNLSYLVYILKHPDEHLPSPFDFEVPFQRIVIPYHQNKNFEAFQEDIWSKSYFFRSLTNKTYFSLIYQNEKYQMYEII